MARGGHSLNVGKITLGEALAVREWLNQELERAYPIIYVEDSTEQAAKTEKEGNK